MLARIMEQRARMEDAAAEAALPEEERGPMRSEQLADLLRDIGLEEPPEQDTGSLRTR